jgi:hypothetical protein
MLGGGSGCFVGQPLLAVPCNLTMAKADSQEWLSYKKRDRKQIDLS